MKSQSRRAPAAQHLRKSHHAQTRQQGRAVSDGVIHMVLEWGRAIRQVDGRVAYFVGRTEIARAAKDGVDLAAADGVAAVVASDGGIVTVIRTDDVRRLRLYAVSSAKSNRGQS